MSLRKSAFAGILLLFFALTACGDATPTFAPERVIAVNTAFVDTGSIVTELSYAGRVRASENIAITSRLPGGMVAEVFADVGDFIETGDVLFTLDPVDLQVNVDALTAQLAAIEASVNAATTGVRLAGGGSVMQSQILQASGAVTQAEAALAHALFNLKQALIGIEQSELGVQQAQMAYGNARQHFNDTVVLFEANIVSLAQMEQVETAYTNAGLGLEQIRAMLEQARNSYAMATVAFEQAQAGHLLAQQSYQLISGEMPAENQQQAQDMLAQATAQRDSVLVNLEAARERLSDATVRSPISGTISSRNVEPHTMMAPGMPHFTFISADTVLVNVEVTGIIINQIKVGQQVSLFIRDAALIPFSGTVTTVSPAANERTATFPVRITVNNEDGIIRPGMFAEVFFVQGRADESIVVVRDAVLVEDGRPVVYLAVGERAVRREVETGLDNGREIEITYGLSVGDELIVMGQTFVTDGSPILVAKRGAE